MHTLYQHCLQLADEWGRTERKRTTGCSLSLSFFVIIFRELTWVRKDRMGFLSHLCFLGCHRLLLTQSKLWFELKTWPLGAPLRFGCNMLTLCLLCVSLNSQALWLSTGIVCSWGKSRKLYANSTAKNGRQSYLCHATLSHQTSPTKCKFKDKIIKHFQMETAEH